MTDNFVHPTAIVDSRAQLDTGISIGPYAIIGPHVRIGKNTRIHSHVIITGHTTLGENNEIFNFAAIGNPPQDLKYKNEPTQLEIGDNNIIREYATLQPGTIQDKGKTVVGNENLLMAYTHVAHDCIIGHRNIIANAVQLAGHVTIQNMTVIGGASAIHQYVRIGDMAMLGGGSIVVMDVPPFCIGEGNRATLRGLNLIGMERNGVSRDFREVIKQVYKNLFYKKHPTLEQAFADIQDFIEIPLVKQLVEFIQTSKRGIIRPGKKNAVRT